MTEDIKQGIATVTTWRNNAIVGGNYSGILGYISHMRYNLASHDGASTFQQLCDEVSNYLRHLSA